MTFTGTTQFIQTRQEVSCPRYLFKQIGNDGKGVLLFIPEIINFPSHDISMTTTCVDPLSERIHKWFIPQRLIGKLDDHLPN